MKLFVTALVVVSLVVTTDALGSDAYLYQFVASGKVVGCNSAQWGSDVLFYNQNPTASVVRLVGISNGTVASDVPTTWTLAPRSAVSLRRLGPTWSPSNPPASGAIVWVLHLDVPEGVTVESRDEVFFHDSCFDVAPFIVTKTSQPVIRSLTPANTPQVKLGTDLGTSAGRINVAIYNASNIPAAAVIEVRRTCDDSTVASANVTIAANTIAQYGPFPTGDASCSSANTEPYPRYTIVTVDQPSFSIVSTLTEGQQQTPGDVLPLLELVLNSSTTF